ncbi:uncharacterized protein LAJ45_11596 [Morchella importuna]|uniref:Uncharacterized protein n=1 Tax=Morchella conica CCBAS932 TaxID=1392247 RepID=A0A3N4KLJ1_9PEZI|nr:uncharacterized protein LAJ45_11596 [Morchella importuna]KAH8144428.1 hypothetical protein LAJ45_11596 [Morchella importuna]RPB11427.1 hypothetical protein P167DRAFT_575439 [Morchella conica CCBAS932]
MASPESTRTGGSRPSGAGVKGLLAMFEKSNPASPAPTSGSTAAGTSSRDQSPAAPRPLGKVRTSFVAVTGNNNGLLGLQKVPVSPSVTSPTVTFPEGQKLSGEALEALGKEHPAIDSRDQITEALNGMRTPDELSSKKDFGIINGGRFSQPKQEPVKPTVLLPAFEKVSTKKDETPVTPIEPVCGSNEDGEKKEGQAKPTKEEPKSKSSTVKGAPAPRSPTKSAFTSKSTKSVATNKSGKTLSLPSSKSNTASPLPSPALAPKSPARNAASSSSSSSRAKSTTTTTNTAPASSRARTPAVASASTSASTVPKSRPTTAASKAKSVATQKSETTKPARESTKPPTVRSSAFASTTASAAKLTAEQKAAAARNARAPSSASVRNRSPPEGSVAMRRGNSGTGSSRPGRKEQRSPQRPQTSAAIRNPNRTSVGSLASITPAGAGGDFLSRMMRPTTASAGKVSDKKPAVGAPSKRSASVASTSRRREPSLPPSLARLVKQKTGEKKTEVAQDAVPEVKEDIAEAAQESKPETTEDPAAPVEAAAPAEVAVEQAPVEQVTVEQASVEKVPVAIEVPTTKDEAEVNEEEDEEQSPTTTTSSTTLVHEGEGKDGEEPAPLVKE